MGPKDIGSTKILGEESFWAQEILGPKNVRFDLFDLTNPKLSGPVLTCLDLPQLDLTCPDLI